MRLRASFVCASLLLTVCAACGAQSLRAGEPPRAAGPRSPLDGPARTELARPVVDIPLTKSGPFYYANVRVNGRPFRLTVETGAGFVGVSNRMAEALALRVDTMEVVPGSRSPVAQIDSISVAGATFRGVGARVSRMYDGGEFDGIISIPLLKDVLATVDLGSSRLRLERGTLPVPNGRDVFAIAGQDRGGRIDVAISLGGVAVPAVLDTRAALWIVAPDSLESQLRLAAPPQAIGSAFGPSLGTFRMRGARLTSDLRIGQFVVERPAVTLRDRPGVLVGVPLLEHFAVTIDQRSRRVRFSPRPGEAVVAVPPQSWEAPGGTIAGAARAPVPAGGERRTAVAGAPPPTTSGQRTMGFNLAGPPGGATLTVLNVVPGSPAATAGLREGDSLVEFNGTPAGSMNPGIWRSAIDRARPVKVVVRRDGGRLEFTVAPHLVP